MARYFDGVDDIIVSQKSTYVVAYSWTFMCWFRTNIASGRKILGAEVGSYFHPHLWVSVDGDLRVGAYDGGFRIVSTPFTVTDNTWRHAVGIVVWNNYVKLYVNANLIGSVSLGTYPDALCVWKVAGYTFSTSWSGGRQGYFPGEIACVKIWRNVELTQDEIKEEMYSIYPRSRLSNLFIFYPLWERGDPSFFLDHSGNDNHGDRYGTTYADDPPMLNRRFVL